jgi:predicted nucleotidyltransferase
MSGFETTVDRRWNFDNTTKGRISVLEKWLRKAGFSLGLTGSVLTKGESNKDLDLIIYPMEKTGRVDLSPAYEVLFAFGFARHMDRERVAAEWAKKDSQDTKHVEVWTLGGKRVDIFFLS